MADSTIAACSLRESPENACATIPPNEPPTNVGGVEAFDDRGCKEQAVEQRGQRVDARVRRQKGRAQRVEREKLPHPTLTPSPKPAPRRRHPWIIGGLSSTTACRPPSASRADDTAPCRPVKRSNRPPLIDVERRGVNVARPQRLTDPAVVLGAADVDARVAGVQLDVLVAADALDGMSPAVRRT